MSFAAADPSSRPPQANSSSSVGTNTGLERVPSVSAEPSSSPPSLSKTGSKTQGAPASLGTDAKPGEEGSEEAEGSSGGDAAGMEKVKKKKEPKKRKVGQACVYCRRSHMTCDSQRPCTRCLKRDIGHLCHDEVPGKGHGHAHHALPKNRPGNSLASQSSAVGSMSPPAAPGQTSKQASRRGAQRTTTSSTSPSGSFPLNDQSPSSLPSETPNRTTDALQSYISMMQTAPPHSIEHAQALYTSQAPISSSANVSAPLAQQTMLFRSTPDARGDQSAGGSQRLGNMNTRGNTGPTSLGPLSDFSTPSNSSTAMPNQSINQLINGGVGGGWVAQPPTSTAAGLGGTGFLGLGGSHGPAFGSESRGGDIAGGHEFSLLSEFLESLDGPGESSISSTAMDSNVPPLDAFAPNPSSPAARPDATPVLERRTPWAPSNQSMDSLPSQRRSPTGATGRGTKRTRAGSSGMAQSPLQRVIMSNQLQSKDDTSFTSSGSDPSALKGFTTSTKTERFFLTAADQVDGPRDERLTKVIQAKYDAGLLRPYNHVKGYARLNSWMDRHVSQSSRRRILKPLSVFRPRFRAVAQSLSDVDLIYIEEAFERLLLDYDRVFSTQGIPACLWRRTGEVYKGNREFAELVGVGIEELREGRLCIYELMEEESACNYWEKYGAVSFDPGQKAVLTSCVLTPRPPRWHSGGSTSATPRGPFSRTSQSGPATAGNSTTATPAGGAMTKPLPENLATPIPKETSKDGDRSGSTDSRIDELGETPRNIQCCFSFTIRRDRFGVPTAIVGNFLPIS